VRGGSPSAYDRILATRLGVAAIQAVRDGESGTMVCLRNNVITRIPLSNILRKMKTADMETITLAQDFSI